MDLNLPILGQLAASKRVLIAGMGGGFDVFCGLPLYFTLQNLGFEVHLANLSFTLLRYQKQGNRLSPSLLGISANHQSVLPYFPEWQLAKWFQVECGKDVTIWCFEKTGEGPLHRNYEILSKELALDAIVLVDGGVDSLMRGDESLPGTLVEDSLSLSAVSRLSSVRVKLLACIGLGAEEEVGHYQMFENMAALTREGAFHGSCALIHQMEGFRLYECAVNYAHAHTKSDASVINASILSAVRGHFGNFHLTAKTEGSRLWISPLMALYWFFDLPAVSRHNQWMDRIVNTLTFEEAMQIVLANLKPTRRARPIPLP